MVFGQSGEHTGSGELRPGVLDGVGHLGVHLVVLLGGGEVAEEEASAGSVQMAVVYSSANASYGLPGR
jgi:hypothetical protein